MCLLIVVRGRFATHPVLVAGNRDERRDRKASPPGLWVGHRRRVLSPRDRVAGGTWLGVNDRGMFASLTNVRGADAPKGAPSRGELPHLALDEDDVEAAVAAVQARVATAPFAGFQLVVAAAARVAVLRHVGGRIQRIDWPEPVLVVSNEHAPGELHLHGLAAALQPAESPQRQLEQLAPLLQDRGGDGRHPVLKTGTEYGTVSSTLLAVPAADPLQLVWRYAAGSPDVTPYRDYGNLGRRLLPGDESSDRPPAT